MSRFLLATIGSLGDIHPMIAIGLVLKQRGHEVIFATSQHYHGRLRALGFTVAGLSPDSIAPTDVDKLAQIMDLRKGSEFLIRDYIFPNIKAMYDDLSALAQGVDVMVVTEIVYAGRLVAEVQKIPWAFLTLAPSSFFSIYDMPVLPGREKFAVLHKLGPIFNRLLILIGKWAGRKWPEPHYQLRRSLGLKPQGNPIFSDKFSPYMVLAAFSSLLGKPQKDWPQSTVITGFAYHDSAPDLFDRDKDDNLKKIQSFLSQGEAPIVFTLGSAAIFAPGDFYRESLAAAKLLNCRAVFLLGQNQLAEDLPPNMVAFDYLPFQAIFPSAAAIVHQGGIGTCAQALRSGKPTLCVPFSHDQPDNARRLAALGTSMTLPKQQYTAQSAAAKLKALLENKSIADKAKEVGLLLQNEDGAQRAADALETLIGRK